MSKQKRKETESTPPDVAEDAEMDSALADAGVAVSPREWMRRRFLASIAEREAPKEKEEPK